MGDGYDCCPDGTEQKFVRGVLDYLKDPPKIDYDSLKTLAERLDQTRGCFSYRIRLSKNDESSSRSNLEIILEKLRNGNWQAWRRLYFEVVDTLTMSRVESASPFGRNNNFWEHIGIKDYI